MRGRFKRSIASLVMVLVSYAAYSALAVPLLEPSVELSTSSSATSITPSSTAKTRGFESLFAEGSWELARPKVLETDRGTLIFDDYRALPNSRMQLNRCTLIFRTESDNDKPGRPIVLRATEGAILFFDGELNIPRGEFGKLIGGELSGLVTIHSPPTPGSDDGLEIATRDVRIEERRIWTPSSVTFRYGPNSGSGGDLSIRMHPPTKTDKTSKAQSRLGRLESIELVRVDKIELQVPEGKSVGSLIGKNSAAASTGSSSQPGSTASSQIAGETNTTPIEIRCRGSLKFDFDEMQLALNDHVDVIRHNADGQSDQLNCQELRLHFDKPEPKANSQDEPKMKFVPTRLVAMGFPVTLRANSYGAFARAEQLEFDLVTQRITMRDREAVKLGNDRTEVTAKWLWYELKEGRQLGNMRAGGPGRVAGQIGDDNQPFEANWKTEVILQEFNGYDVLSLVDDARVSVTNAGDLLADQLHIYLSERPRSDDPKRSAITADQLKAIGNVRIDSARIAGTLQDVQIWFKQPSPDDVSQQASSSDDKPSSSLLSNRTPNATTDDDRKLMVQADRLNAEVQLGDNPQLLQLAAQGRVHCEELAAPGSASAMSLDCEIFQVLDGASENPIATIEGTKSVDGQPAIPARVMAEGAMLVGQLMEIHQGSNRAFVKGAGQMTLPRPKTPQSPWFVQWQHQMRFDGQEATFEGNVNARGVQIMNAGENVRFTATGDSLGVKLTRYVDFRNPNDTDELGLRELRFNGRCVFDSETLDPRGARKTSEKMVLHDLVIDQVKGTLHGDGPGWLSSVHQGQDIFKEGQFASAPRGLHFLRVDFQQEVVGNITGKQIEFLGNVRTVYGPVTGWDQVIDVSDPSQLGPRDVVVTSQRLALADMGQSRDRFDAIELEATGNAFVRGQTFNASAQRISYVKAKDQLVLEGDGRNDATLAYQRTPNSQPAPLKARKILFWPETKQFEISDLHSFDLQDVGQFRQ